MTIVQSALLVLGMATCARGVYALATRDIIEENEHMTGRPAARFGAILVGIGLGIVSHAVYQWPWVTSTVEWLREQHRCLVASADHGHEVARIADVQCRRLAQGDEGTSRIDRH